MRWIIAALAFALAGPTYAADLNGPKFGPEQPTVSARSQWTGPWIEAAALAAATGADASINGGAFSFADTNAGIGFGLGYDVQVAPGVVLGALARYDFVRSKDTIGAPGDVVTLELRDMWTVAARVGFVPKSDIMFYGLAGVAGSEGKATVTSGAITVADKERDTGLVLGVGVEAQIAGPVGLRLEYDHVQWDFTGGLDATQDIVRAGAVWRY